MTKKINPERYQNVFSKTLFCEATCTILTIESIISSIQSEVIYSDVFFTTFCTALVGLGVLVSENIAFSGYGKTKRYLDYIQESSIKSNNELETLVINFDLYCKSKGYSFDTSINVLTKFLYEMKRSGYTNEEISEHIISLMYESKDSLNYHKEFKKVRKFKSEI